MDHGAYAAELFLQGYNCAQAVSMAFSDVTGLEPAYAARLISSFGKYAYGESYSTAYCHLYAQGDISFENGVEMTCETAYPYDFTVRYRIRKGGRIAIRIPARCRAFTLEINGQKADAEKENGYIYLSVLDGDDVLLTLEDGVRFLYPSPRIPALTGRIAIMRGPLVYCFEGVDNNGDVLSLCIGPKEKIAAESCESGPLAGSIRLTLDAVRLPAADELYTESEPSPIPCRAVAIPYYLWGNRGENQMRVWMCKV